MPSPSGADRPPDDVSPAFRRSAEFWLRAYPRRWRSARAEEVLGVLADLARPGAHRLDVRSALNLVRGGWATRLREHPPLGPWLLYRVFGTRSLPAHLPWVADDIAGATYPARQSAPIWLMFAGLEVFSRLATGSAGPFGRAWLAFALVVAVQTLILPDYYRRSAMNLHLVPAPGHRVARGSWARVPTLRRRLAARSALPWAACSLVVLLGSCVAAALLAPSVVAFGVLPPGSGLGVEASSVPAGRATTGTLLAIAVAVGLGSLLAAAARRRLRDCRVPEQPHRVIVTMAWRRALVALFGVGLLSAIPVGEAIGAWPLSVSVPLGMAAGVLAPPAVVAWLAVCRGASRSLVWADVRRIALLGRPPGVDEPATALAPADESEVGTVRPWPWSGAGPTPVAG